MTREVIDLISSSPPPESRSPPPSTQLSDKFSRQTADRNGYAHVVDPGSQANSKDNRSVNPKRSSIAAHDLDGRDHSRTVLPDGIEIWSDDFDSTGNLDETFTSERSGNKRRRISPLPASLPEHMQPPPSAQPERPARRVISALEAPSSPDPFAASPPSSPKRVAQPPSHEQPSSSNPFASSPILTTKNAISGLPSLHSGPDRTPLPPPDSSNPFESSPQPRHGDTQAGHGRTEKRLEVEILSSPSSPYRFAQTRRPTKAWDPISSSAPEATTRSFTPPRRVPTDAVTIAIDSDSTASLASGSDNEELPDINKLAESRWKSRSAFGRSLSEAYTSTREKATKRAPAKRSVANAAAKEAEKERKKQERQIAKEAKLREKERAAALAEVNKARTDRKVSTKEMIIDLPSDLRCITQAETFLDDLGVERTLSGSDKVVKWRRKVASRFNEDLGHWEPIPPRIVAESFVGVIMTADDFVTLAVDQGIAGHYRGIEVEFPGYQIIYLLEGLTPWMRKNRNNRNRQFTSGVRGQESVPGDSGRRRPPQSSVYVSEDIVEDALIELQVSGALIHQTTVGLETAQWLATLTQHISTIPYRKQRDEAQSAGFCMESGQVRTGDTTGDTYIRMLQEIVRVTAPIAHGIAAECGSVTKLVTLLERSGPGRLEGIRKTLNSDGALSDRTIGQAISKRMHKVFTGRDESSTDI